MTDTPPLWPDHDPSHPGPMAAAWRDLWAWTAAGPVDWSSAREELAGRHGLQTRTTDNLIRQAVKNRHLTKRGGYSHKHHTDTRTIERRDPST